MRTFIAIKIIPEKKLLDIVSTLRKTLEGEAISWVDTNNLHLTLRFLGETSDEQVSKIAHLLDNIFQNYHRFQFNLKGVGFFKSKNKPRVLFLSVENDLLLKQLAAEIEEMVVSLGLSREEKLFNPHLTLGRIKFLQNKDAFYSLADELNGAEIQYVNVFEIIYYQSVLSSAGAIYKPIHQVQLKK
jgi:RNA 2',3'-cyclic 3'-phosphodiesterase